MERVGGNHNREYDVRFGNNPLKMFYIFLLRYIYLLRKIRVTIYLGIQEWLCEGIKVGTGFVRVLE